MNEKIIRFYYFYGDDDYAIEQAVKSLKSKMGEPSAASMNITEYDGGSMSLQELRETTLSMPFLNERRLVILNHLEHLRLGKEIVSDIVELLGLLPDTTALVFTDKLEKTGEKAIAAFQGRSPWLKWVDTHPQSGYARLFLRREGAQFVTWMRTYCKERGGDIEIPAAQLLASLVADNAQLATLELDKLMAYTSNERGIQVADVEQLTPYNGESDIFDMVDAIGNRQGQIASKHLHRLLEDQDPMFVFLMIARQFRLILQVREALDAGENPAQAVKMHPFVLRKISQQATHFALEDIERVMHHLHEIDIAVKTGQGYLETSLYSLMAALTG